MNAIINIIKANYLGGYSIELEFNDGKSQKVNFEPFLQKSLHPEIRSYLNQDRVLPSLEGKMAGLFKEN